MLDTRYVWDLPDHLLVDKTFDCGDGLIHLRLQVHYSDAGDETFTWTILAVPIPTRVSTVTAAARLSLTVAS